MTGGLWRRVERLHGMDEATWARHANPWSVWTRVPILPVAALVLWHRGRLGRAGTLAAVGALAAWTWWNPRAFPPPRRLDSWAARGALGEQAWLARRERPIPSRHRVAPHVLAGLSATGMVPLARGAVAARAGRDAARAGGGLGGEDGLRGPHGPAARRRGAGRGGAAAAASARPSPPPRAAVSRAADLPPPPLPGDGSAGRRARVRYDEAMMREAVRAFVARRVLGGRRFLTAWALLAGGAAWLAFGAGGPSSAGASLVVATALLLPPIFALWLWRAHLANTLAHFRGMDPPEAEVAVGEAGLGVSSAAGAAFVPWDGFAEAWERPRFLMLFLATGGFVALPKAGLGAGALDLLRARLPGPAGRGGGGGRG